MNKLLGAIVATVTIAGCLYFSSKPASSQKTDNPTISYLDSHLVKLSDVNAIVGSTIALNNQGNMIPDILAAHNKYRAQVGIPPLKWSNKIASSAQTWANQLAKMGKMQHSTSQARSGYGENLWMGTAGAFSFTQMVDSWGSEKKNFIPNKAFPNVSKTGNWADVGHYTQIVWKNTTEVGCALTQGSGNNYLVCQYNPPGNFQGQKPY